MSSPSTKRACVVPRPAAPVFLLAVCVLAGCHSLPDVQPFADATAKLRHTVASTGDNAVSQISRLPAGETNAALTAELANRLRENWARRNQVMEALDNYASALAGVVQAGNSGAATVKALGSAVGGLAQSLDVAFPGGGGAASSVTQLAADLGAIAAREWAAHVLVQRLKELDPVIQSVAKVLSADLGNLKNISWADRVQALTALAQESGDLVRINDLKRRRRDAFSEVLHAPLTATPGQTNLSERLTLLQQIDETMGLETRTPGYADYLKNVTAVETAADEQNAILDQAVLLLHAWAGAHHQMLLAVQEKRPPSLQELVQVASDLQEVYKQIHMKGAKP